MTATATDGSKKLWSQTGERDNNNGEMIKTIQFTDALPYIVLGFYCYITHEVNLRYEAIQAASSHIASAPLDIGELDDLGGSSATGKPRGKTNRDD